MRGQADAEADSVQQLLHEVARYRLALETDLAIAAAALDAGAPEVAATVVAAERQHLADFAASARERLHPGRLSPVAGRGSPSSPAGRAGSAGSRTENGVAQATHPPAGAVAAPPSATRRRPAVGLMLASAALASCAVAGSLALPHRPAPGPIALDPVALDAARSFGALRVDLAHRRLDDGLVDAAALARGLRPLVARAPTDAAAGRTAARLLRDEELLLQQGAGGDPALTGMLATTRSLLVQLQTGTPTSGVPQQLTPATPSAAPLPGTGTPAGTATSVGPQVPSSLPHGAASSSSVPRLP